MEAKDMNEMEPRIIEAAKRVFVRKGYEAATMSDVAAEVGIGRTALHYYYRTKEILFDAIFGQLLSSLLPNIDRVLDEKSTMLEKMPVIVDLYMGIVRANPMFPNFVVGELNRDPERLFQTVLRDLGYHGFRTDAGPGYFRSDDKGRFGKPPELYYELSYAESKARFGIYPEGIWRVT